MAAKSLTVAPQETKRLLDQDKILLLDVRTTGEREICNIAGSTHIPIDELPERYRELPSTAIIIYCHSGGRSLRAAKFLAEKGMDTKSMTGGIEEWSLKIDPSVPRY